MNSIKKIITFSLLHVVLTLPLAAQNVGAGELLMQRNKMVAVVIVVLIILMGIVVLLVSMERRIKRLENQD